MEKSQQEIVEAKYLDGNSLEDIKNYLEFNNIEKDEQLDIIRKAHTKHQTERNKNAKISLLASIGSFVFFLKMLHRVFVQGYTGNNYHILFLSFFIWIPFMRSYYNIVRDKKRFDAI